MNWVVAISIILAVAWMAFLVWAIVSIVHAIAN